MNRAGWWSGGGLRVSARCGVAALGLVFGLSASFAGASAGAVLRVPGFSYQFGSLAAASLYPWGIAALADGFQSYAVIDASGGFTQTQVDMGILRMQHAGVIPVCYSNVAVEILADNAAPEAEAVYGALGMPFSGLVFGLRQYFSRA